MNFENGLCLIKDLRYNQTNVNLHFIVLDLGKTKVTQIGPNVRQCRIADRSGAINISVWGDKGDIIQPGDICRLINGHVNLYNGCLTATAGKKGDIKKIGEFCMIFSETPFMSDPNSEFIPKLEIEGKTTNQLSTFNITDSISLHQSIPLPNSTNNMVSLRNTDVRLNETRNNDRRLNDPRKQLRPPNNISQSEPPSNNQPNNKNSFFKEQQRRPK